MESPPPCTAMTMPTPPLLTRAKLPSSSPSSARLRRLAPSPVKVPPTPPLVFSPGRVLASHTTLGAAIRSPAGHVLVHQDILHDQEDPFEYDFAPLELAMQSEVLLESCREVLEQCRDVAARRNSSIDSNASVPLIFDARGDFGKLAGKVRDVDGPDVPNEPDAEGSRSKSSDRGGEVLMSPRDYFATCVPRKVMVEFRDVFGSPSNNATTMPDDDDTQPGRTTRDTSLAESFNTFGPRTRKPSGESTQDDDDGWSYTLSAYESDDGEDPLGHRSRRQSSMRSPRIPDISEPLLPLPPHLRFIPPETDSPLSIPNTELVTPEQHIIELPRFSIITTSSDTPTQKPPHPLETSHQAGGLQLDVSPRRTSVDQARHAVNRKTVIQLQVDQVGRHFTFLS